MAMHTHDHKHTLYRLNSSCPAVRKDVEPPDGLVVSNTPCQFKALIVLIVDFYRFVWAHKFGVDAVCVHAIG